ncbi:MAG: hypothetical protein LIO93_12820 [Bacteroidales bacterium]|nr:hypothetical protein [Bacteroidales bacterium]
MKLSDKRFWSGEKTVYYPNLGYALTDSLLFSIFWTLAICLILCSICLSVHLNNGSGENLSLRTISIGLVFLFIVFITANGMFLYENWIKQCRIIDKVKKLLPEGSDMLNIKFDVANKEYKITLKYIVKIFRVTVEYPSFYISEKGVRALGPLNMDSRKCLEENKSFIMDYMITSKYYCAVCGLPLDFNPQGNNGKTPTYDICPCCGVKWGNEDYTTESRTEYRNKWLAAGAKWFEPQKKPENWNLEKQLNNIEQYKTDR